MNRAPPISDPMVALVRVRETLADAALFPLTHVWSFRLADIRALLILAEGGIPMPAPEPERDPGRVARDMERLIAESARLGLSAARVGARDLAALVEDWRRLACSKGEG